MPRLKYHAASKDLLPQPEFCSFKVITADQNERLQARANAVVRRLVRRRVKKPDKLLAAFRAALQDKGFIRVNLLPMSSTGDISFKAGLGKKLKARLRGLEHLPRDEVGWVTGAARHAGLDPRIEDIGVGLLRNRVEGNASAVPFVHQTRALDKVMG